MRGLVTVAHRIDRPWLDNVKRCNNAASAEFSKSYFLKRDVETHESHFSRTVAHRRWSFPCFSRVSWKQPATVQNHIKKIKKIQHCLATDKTLACLAVQKKKKNAWHSELDFYIFSCPCKTHWHDALLWVVAKALVMWLPGLPFLIVLDGFSGFWVVAFWF